MSSKKHRINADNLRRSTRTELLKKKADALKTEIEKQNLEKEKERMRNEQRRLEDDKLNLATTMASLKKKKKKKKKFKKLSNKSSSLSLYQRAEDYNDDGFILDEPVEATSNQPKQFDELELWKQYQNYNTPDDGFILDEETEPDKNTTKVDKLPVQVLNKRKLSENWKRDSFGRKLSKKKRRKAERKWLKKMFHESVIIAEPQETESNSQSEVSSLEQTVTVSAAQLPGSDDEEMPVLDRHEIPVAISDEMFPMTEMNGTPENISVTANSTNFNEEEHLTSASPSCGNNINQAVGGNIEEIQTYPESLHINGNSSYSVPSWGDDRQTHQPIDDFISNQPLGQNLRSLSEEEKTLRTEWENSRKTSGLSKLAFSEHLLKLYKQSCKGCASPVKEQSKSTEPQMSTSFIDLTSGKAETDDRKKRYKMELSLPEGTTILVTNMVDRDSTLPKVIFMLKKSSPNGVIQESPLLMGCSNDSDRQGNSGENNSILEKELREIAKNFLRLQNGTCDKPNLNEPLAIPKALEYSME